MFIETSLQPYHLYLGFFESYLRVQFQEDKYSDGSTELLSLYEELQKQIQPYFPNQEISQTELFLITLSLIPHLDPVRLDRLFAELLGEGNFPQLGGVRGKQHRGILPTGEMALFLLAKDDPEQRVKVHQSNLSHHSWLFRDHILDLEPPLPGEPRLSGKLLLYPEYVELFTTGEVSPPRFSIDFPAQHITTKQEWQDLILHSHTHQQVHDVEAWLRYGKSLLTEWNLDKQVKPGYRVLFYGPPGTGKTLTATLLGKSTAGKVFRIDLSMIVSKYVGETEKNLARIFDKSENKNWILFFDEADALFGKRTGVRDAHDRYANQEIAYLLQRVEEYDGLVILASNMKENIDKAFLRRLQAIVFFPVPGPNQRLRIWENTIPKEVSLAEEVDLERIAGQYELTGADIVNIVHYCCLKARNENTNKITWSNLQKGIQRELIKLGKK